MDWVTLLKVSNLRVTGSYDDRHRDGCGEVLAEVFSKVIAEVEIGESEVVAEPRRGVKSRRCGSREFEK